MYRYYGNDFFSIMVYDGVNYNTVATYAGENLGAKISRLRTPYLDLSPYRSTQFKSCFVRRCRLVELVGWA
ncbi:MAG: hypothetical protein IPN94_16025 [Sphingobacteriales bacterium]|nr:hypothetical protein [Sphingobacteriales bacterium]